MSVDKEKPSVLIFHTHTTESYQILDRDFYAVGHLTRSNDSSKNMVRVGEAIVEELEKAGFSQYEISNFSLKGYESRHNLKYWRCEEYLGIGPSAHSFVDGKRFFFERNFSTSLREIIPLGCFGKPSTFTVKI